MKSAAAAHAKIDTRHTHDTHDTRHAAVAGRLYEHQVAGVAWLWRLACMRRGGILADDMGLGKVR